MYDEVKSEGAKTDELTVSRVDGDFRAAYRAKSKLVEREKEDFLYSLGEQWSEEDRTALEKAKIKPATDNQIAPNLYLLTGLERQNRTDFKAFPEGEEDGLRAEIASYLFKKSIDVSDYANKSSEQFKDGITCGECHLELYLDNTDNLINGKPMWKKLDGCQVFPDPASREYDFSDARYVFKVTRDIHKEDLVSLYPEKEKEINGIANGKLGYEIGSEEKHIQKLDYGTRGSSSDGYNDEKDCVDLVERYYKKFVPHVFIGDLKTGEIVQADSAEKADAFISNYQASIEHARMAYEQAAMMASMPPMMDHVSGQVTLPPPVPHPPIAEDPNRYKKITRSIPEIWVFAYVPNMTEPLANERAWFYPKWKSYPIVPFYARFSTAPITGDDRHLLVQGLVHGVKNAQERHNKATTLMLRHLNSSANSGWLAEQDAWVNPDEVRNFGSLPGINLEYKNGKKPERITPTPLSNAHAQISEQAVNGIKTALGINADLLAVQQGGTDSGRAIALRQKQGLLMVQELFDNLTRSRKVAGRFVLSQLGKMFDTETAKRVLGDAFLKKNFPPLMLANEQTGQPEPMTDATGQPMAYDKEMAELVIAEVLSGDLGEYDVSVGESVSSETLRMANAVELKELAKAFPGAISPELIIEESQLPQATKTKIVDAIKNARMSQAGPMAGQFAGQGA